MSPFPSQSVLISTPSSSPILLLALHQCHLMTISSTGTISLSGIDKPVQDGKLYSQFDAVNAGFVCPLQIKQIGVRDTEERDVEEDYEDVCVDEQVQRLSIPVVELGDVAVMVQMRGIFEILARLEDIEDGEKGFLEEENRDLDAVPDEVDGS